MIKKNLKLNVRKVVLVGRRKIVGDFRELMLGKERVEGWRLIDIAGQYSSDNE